MTIVILTEAKERDLSISTGDLEYPVICIGNDGFLEKRVDQDTMETATTRELKRGCFVNMTVIDIDGKTVRIDRTELISGKGSLWGYAFLCRVIRVRHFLSEDVPQIPFEELKEIVIKDVKKWGYSTPDQEYIRGEVLRISKAASYQELIELAEGHLRDRKKNYESDKRSLRDRVVR